MSEKERIYRNRVRSGVVWAKDFGHCGRKMGSTEKKPKKSISKLWDFLKSALIANAYKELLYIERMTETDCLFALKCKSMKAQDWTLEDFQIFLDYDHLKNRTTLEENSDRKTFTRLRRNFLSALIKCTCNGKITEVTDVVSLQDNYSLVRKKSYKYFLYEGRDLPNENDKPLVVKQPGLVEPVFNLESGYIVQLETGNGPKLYYFCELSVEFSDSDGTPGSPTKSNYSTTSSESDFNSLDRSVELSIESDVPDAFWGPADTIADLHDFDDDNKLATDAKLCLPENEPADEESELDEREDSFDFSSLLPLMCDPVKMNLEHISLATTGNKGVIEIPLSNDGSAEDEPMDMEEEIPRIPFENLNFDSIRTNSLNIDSLSSDSVEEIIEDLLRQDSKDNDEFLPDSDWSLLMDDSGGENYFSNNIASNVI